MLYLVFFQIGRYTNDIPGGLGAERQITLLIGFGPVVQNTRMNLAEESLKGFLRESESLCGCRHGRLGSCGHWHERSWAGLGLGNPFG